VAAGVGVWRARDVQVPVRLSAEGQAGMSARIDSNDPVAVARPRDVCAAGVLNATLPVLEN